MGRVLLAEAKVECKKKDVVGMSFGIQNVYTTRGYTTSEGEAHIRGMSLRRYNLIETMSMANSAGRYWSSSDPSAPST